MLSRIAAAHVLVVAANGCEAKPSPTAPAAQTPTRTETAAPPTPDAKPAPKKQPPLPVGVTWPVADGWRREVIPFPLEFAPTVAKRGVEELRFAPDFFKPDAPTFWSYTFVWLLDDAAATDLRSLEPALVTYFSGLADAVGGTKYTFAPARYRAALRSTTAPAGWRAWQGTFDGYEPFVTGKPLTLHLEARVGTCGARQVWLFAASPQAPEHEVWTRLRESVAAFRCE
jgi:hypothetical protein